jgi:hypothetical protein
MDATTFTLLQLLAAFWASVACAAVAYYGCGCGAALLPQKDKTPRAAAPVTTPAPPGSPRRLVFAALPAALLLAASPSLFVDRHRAPICVTPVLGQLSLTSFKLLAFSVGRGPLAALLSAASASAAAAAAAASAGKHEAPNDAAAQPPRPFAALDFIAWAVAPVLPPPTRRGAPPQALPPPPPSRAEARALLRAALPQALGAAFAGVIAGGADAWGIPRPVKFWFYTLLLSQSVTCVWQLWRYGAARLPCPPFSRPLRTAPSFDAPWLSDSLADYWGRRWNVTTGRALRALAYDPIVEGRLVAADEAATKATAEAPPPAAAARDDDDGDGGDDGGDGGPPRPSAPLSPPRPTPLRRFLALQATFVLSGAWHAAVLYPPNTGSWRGAWRWLLFFSLWAPALVAERRLVRAWRKARLPAPPRPLRVALVNALLIAVATPLFFGPCDSTGMCARMFEHARAMVGWGGGGGGGEAKAAA